MQQSELIEYGERFLAIITRIRNIPGTMPADIEGRAKFLVAVDLVHAAFRTLQIVLPLENFDEAEVLLSSNEVRPAVRVAAWLKTSGMSTQVQNRIPEDTWLASYRNVFDGVLEAANAMLTRAEGVIASV